jgi:hypothetical protein
MITQAKVMAVLMIIGLASAALGEGSVATDNPARCSTISDNAARLRCFESLLPGRGQRAQSSTALPGGWRFVRTPNPQGGLDAMSVMHTADLARSDPDLAGLMLRCGEAGFEVLLVTIRPFSFRTRPMVLIGAQGAPTRFEATVAPPGSALLLPQEANGLAGGAWQSASELAIQVENGANTIRGVIPIEGLRSAVEVLAASCRA